MTPFRPIQQRSSSPPPPATAPDLLSPTRSFSSESAMTPTRNDSVQTHGQPLSPPTGLENTPSWSSAVGHATTSGKSGRVIERLMSENDKLKRDLNAQIVKCQELEKSLQTYKPQIETLRQENDNLSHARDVDSGLIARRDRKIEGLKTDLAAEKSRREFAERSAKEREQQKDAIEETSRREVQTLSESTKHAVVHAEILETSHRQLGQEYRSRTEAFKKELSSLMEGRERDRQRLAKLDVVADQMRQELERSQKLNGQIVDTWEKLRTGHQEQFDEMLAETRHENESSRKLSMQMEQAVNEMRWVMGVKKHVKDAQ